MALQEIDESLLAASKAKFLAKYDQNYDGRISLEEVYTYLDADACLGACILRSDVVLLKKLIKVYNRDLS